MPDPEVKSDRPKPDPKALSPEYHKARKQLMLWAGILFIWELVGIDLDKAKETGGNAGAIITAIKSPQAIPWVLLILVAYFLFKTTIEWYQCSSARRNLRVSRVDFGSAWTVSLSAYALYIYQAVKKVQVADVVQGSGGGEVASLTMGGFVAFMTGFMLLHWIRMRYQVFERVSFRPQDLIVILPTLLLWVVVWITMRFAGVPIHWSSFGKGTLIGFATALFLNAAVQWGPVGLKYLFGGVSFFRKKAQK